MSRHVTDRLSYQAPFSTWAFPCDEHHQGDACKITFCENGKDCQGSCPKADHSSSDENALVSNGQACYWFSNGCTIGCDRCDGTQNHVGHGNQRFLFQGMSQAELNRKNITIPDPFSPPRGSMVLDPSSTKGLEIKSNCGDRRTTNATICDSRLRTANTQAECGSHEDFYYFSPWRAPGSAPVIDASLHAARAHHNCDKPKTHRSTIRTRPSLQACGSAGGRFAYQSLGPAGAQYQNTSLAREGDVGSRLPAGPSQATWKAGDAVEVGWTVMANHGGGYAYRLARADAPLTEKTFQEMPLDFVGGSVLRWGGDKSTQLPFDPKAKGWETNKGTVPAGSTWRKNPVPSGLWSRMGPQFQPVCEESEECIRGFSEGLGARQGACKCSGYSNGGPLLPNLEIVDRVRVPSTLAPGRYVLQWRWDCEESDQVWASCSDVTVV